MRELSVLIEKTSGAVSGTAMMFNGGAGASLLIFPELAAKVVGTGALSRVIGKLFGGRIPRIYLLVIVLAAINLANAAELDGRIRLTGSSTIAPLVLEIARRFEESHDNVRIDVESGGSQRGINDLIQQRVDMALVSRALSKAEVDEVGLVENAIAHDGLCLIVHKNNPIFQINRPDLLGIYKGEITNWSDIGGPNIPITVITKADGRATLDVFLTVTRLKVTDIEAHVIIGENLQGIKTVSGNEGAIENLSIGAVAQLASLGSSATHLIRKR